MLRSLSSSARYVEYPGVYTCIARNTAVMLLSRNQRRRQSKYPEIRPSLCLQRNRRKKCLCVCLLSVGWGIPSLDYMLAGLLVSKLEGVMLSVY